MAKKIVIDAGHGAHDGGAVGIGLLEKNVNLDIALEIKKELEKYKDAEVKLTRSTDKFLTLGERVKIANDWKADAFISVHINSAGGTNGDGFESYIYNGPIQKETPALQDAVHKAILREVPFFEDRGQKKANFAVVRETMMPAVLTENGFINNPSNREYLKKPENIKKIASGHAKGIAVFLNLSVKERAPINKEPAKTTAKKLYKVQVGAFADEDNARRQAQQLERDGYNTYIVEE